MLLFTSRLKYALRLKQFIQRNRWTSRVLNAVAVCASLLVGFLVYFLADELECQLDTDSCSITDRGIDALYLTIVTISTASRIAHGPLLSRLTCQTRSQVGYGDIAPASPGLRVFTILYILAGCAFTFVQLASLCAGLLEAFTRMVKRILGKRLRIAELVARPEVPYASLTIALAPSATAMQTTSTERLLGSTRPATERPT